MAIKKITFPVVGILFAFAVKAYATGEGFYIGVQAGETNTHNQARSLQILQIQNGIPNPDGSITLDTITVNASNTGPGGRLFLGYNINTYFAMEGGFTHYHASTYKVGSPYPPLITGNPVGDPGIQENGFDLVGKGILPIGNFGFFGKAGVAIIRTSLAGTLTQSVTNINVLKLTLTYLNPNGTTNYVRPTAAIGASYDITPNLVGELTVSRVFSNGEFKNADLYSLGISYHFVDKYCGQFLC